MASDIWLRTIVIVRKETRCRHIGYSFRLRARVLLYAPSFRQDSTYHDLCYTSRGALAGTRNSSMSPPHEGSIRRPIASGANAVTTELHLAPCEKGNPLPPHRLLFPISSKGSFICTSHRQDSTYHGLCYTSRGSLAGTRNCSMGPPHEGSIRRPIASGANAFTTELHLAPTTKN